MTQEYLFVGNEHKTKVQKYKPAPGKIKIETVTLRNTDCWMISYTIDGENEDSANILSAVNNYITENFSPTILTNDSSAYYNKRLFPYVNEFERKLRKLLYLKSAVNKNDAVSENIKNLEEQDLGEIFELLFTDDSFISAVKGMILKKTYKFTKSQIFAQIEAIDENANWDHLIGEVAVPALKESHQEVRAFRNDVMHAHNIDAKVFRKAFMLFRKINAQLDSEIGTVMEIAEKQIKRKEISDYNTALRKAIQLSEQYAKITELVKQATSPELLALQEVAREVTFSQNSIKLQELLKEIKSNYPKIEIPYSSILESQKAFQLRQTLLDLYGQRSKDDETGNSQSDSPEP